MIAAKPSSSRPHGKVSQASERTRSDRDRATQSIRLVDARLAHAQIPHERAAGRHGESQVTDDHGVGAGPGAVEARLVTVAQRFASSYTK